MLIVTDWINVTWNSLDTWHQQACRSIVLHSAGKSFQ